MTIDFLQEFVVLAQVGNYHEAADFLYISTSSLSKHIKALEFELGHSLFERGARKVKLTEFGSNFIPYATKMLELQQEYQSKLLSNLHENVEDINIGISQLVNISVFLPFISILQNDYPECHLNFMNRHSSQLLDLMRSGECDVAIIDIEASADLSEFETIPLATDTLVAVVPENHPLAKKDVVTLAEVGTYPYIHSGKYVDYDTHIIKNPLLTVSSCAQVMQLVKNNFGVSILPKNVATYYSDNTVKLIDMEVTPQIPIALAYRKASIGEMFKQVIEQYEQIRSRY